MRHGIDGLHELTLLYGMKYKGSIITLLLCGICFIATSQTATTPAPKPVYPLPSAQQMAWHEMEMNAFVHFTVNTFTDKEWGYGDESEMVFNPSQPDPRQWAKILKETGFKTLILTCKHHDGFASGPRNTPNTP